MVILTSLLSIVSLFVIAKIMGHKQISQMDFFDYICGITIGSIAAELATELEEPYKPFIALVLFGLVSLLLSIITNKLPKTRKFINGTPTILMSDGKLYRKNMKKAKLDLSEFMLLCREQGYFELKDIQTVVFETNGKLSILPVSEKRPANPSDFGITPESAEINTEIIMDGRIMDENLHRLGLDMKWLEKQLSEQGYSSAKEVFLAVSDKNNKLTVYGFD